MHLHNCCISNSHSNPLFIPPSSPYNLLKIISKKILNLEAEVARLSFLSLIDQGYFIMEIWLWAGFFTLIIGMLILDLGVFHKTPREVSTKEALAWSLCWVTISLVFNVFVYFLYEYHWFGMGLNGVEALSGREAALQFFAGYVIEKSLSLDNIVIIALVFSYFKVPLMYQHRVLFWGILGVLVLRFIMILGGIVLISTFAWINYVFGVLLIFTAVKMLSARHDNVQPEKNALVRLAYRFFTVTETFHEDHFFVQKNGSWQMTPLFIVLVIIESSDILFAIDSIPAIFAVTQEPFLVFTSNIFAILGLRSLYFALASMMQKFDYLKTSLAFLMGFVGVKMLMAHYYPIPIGASLAIIGGILLIGVLASIFALDTAPLKSPIAENEFSQMTLRQLKKIITLVVGSTILLAGMAMLILPGPAFVVIPIGLAILGKEFLWAREWYEKIKDQGKSILDKISGNNRDKDSKP